MKTSPKWRAGRLGHILGRHPAANRREGLGDHQPDHRRGALDAVTSGPDGILAPMAQGMRSCRPAGEIYMDMSTDSPASAQVGASLLANAERLGYAGRGIAGFYQVLT